MRKNELIHLHALLECLRADIETRGEKAEDEVSTGLLREYESLGVSAMAVQASRDEHREAVLALARALAASVGDTPPAEASGREDADRPGESGEPERQPA